MKQLSKEQKKIIYIVIGALIFILSFWIFIYAPQGKRLSDIRSKLAYTEAQISEINKIIQNKDLALVMTQLNQELSLKAARLPALDDQVINYLSDQAKQFKVDIKNIDPSDRQALENKISGYRIEELPITLEISCDFRALGEYLGALRSDSSILIRFKQLSIQGLGEGRLKLDSRLVISAYLAKAENSK